VIFLCIGHPVSGKYLFYIVCGGLFPMGKKPVLSLLIFSESTITGIARGLPRKRQRLSSITEAAYTRSCWKTARENWQYLQLFLKSLALDPEYFDIKAPL
jgi:hypothetical protein